MTTYTEQVGALMRQARLAQGMSREAVEENSGGRFGAAALGMWERGDRGIQTETLCAYARFLGVDVAELLPPEPHHGEQVLALAARIARDAADQLTSMLTRIDPVTARSLLRTALAEKEPA